MNQSQVNGPVMGDNGAGVWRYAARQLAEIVDAAPPAQTATCTSVSTDSRTIQPGAAYFALRGERFDGNDFVDGAFERGAAVAICQRPSSKGPCLIVPDALAALQRLAAHHRRRFDIPLVAITGSCGKTTTKDLVAAVLGSRMNVVKTQGNLNNEIGCPLSLMQIGPRTGAAVIEMGANHPLEIARLCEIAAPTESTIVLVAPAHLEGFGSIENVARAKAEIVDGLKPGGVYYMNVDDPYCVKAADRFEGRVVRVGSHGDVVLEDCSLDARGWMDLRVAPVGKLHLPVRNRAFAINVLIAVAVGLEHGIVEFQEPLERAAHALKRFSVFTLGPLTVFDDTYNANPASMEAALRAVAEAEAGKRMAALGGMLELGSAAPELHRKLGELAAILGYSHVFAFGECACDTIAGARAGGAPVAEAMQSHEDIARAISSQASPGDALLVKGSRGTRMEGVIDALRRLYA